MSHLRLRKFNTKKTYPEQSLDNDLSMSVRATGTHVFLRGQVGQDLKGRMVGVGDPAAQTEQAMANVKTLLEEQGAKLEDICKITVYITDRAYREPVYRVVGKWLKGVFPGLDRPHRPGPRPAGMGDGDRCLGGDPRGAHAKTRPRPR